MKPLNKSIETIDEGWSVQIYDGKRRLICSLEPSHGWLFSGGCLMGFLLAIILFNLNHNYPKQLPKATPPKSVEQTLPID
ncbi:hypothetical protein [Crocosphaera sp. XPORK-15E]|uniref:hypothetical protein n=1 Tax=Crocosphaera sp. XPORK-15E TaxID=3110247 RepID=UPI002B1FC2AC|nr:hypothetical protein [Crocosphaera sp. XPORK-15E]MEA5537250.1 hypothetical protein [Crocosphaera sp. XPORK-15E]